MECKTFNRRLMGSWEDDDYPAPVEEVRKATPEMPFGKHKGKLLSQVPPDYLLWLYNDSQLKGTNLDPIIKAYIEANLEALHEEAKIKKP